MDDKLIKSYGAGAFITGKELVEYQKEFVPVSPCLDVVLGGGIPGGCYVNLIGESKAGKTISALHIAGNAQQLGRKVYYFNIEGRIKSRDLQGIKHLDQDKLTIVRSYKNDEGESRILTAEEYLTIAEHVIHNVPGSVLIFDSVSQLATEKDLNADIGDQLRAPGPVLMAQFLKKMSNVVPVNDNIIISILHLIANTSGFGASKVPSGGRKIFYAADIILTAKSFKYIRPGVQKEDTDEGTEPAIGQEVVWLTTSTATIAPGQKITSIIRYGIGIDEIAELIKLGVDTGFIMASGAWLKLTYLKDKVDEIPNIQGREKLYHYFCEHNDHLEILRQEIRKMLIP